MLSVEVIHRPSEGVIKLLYNRIHDKEGKGWLEEGRVESVGLVQGPLSAILAAMDVAEKAADVKAVEVSGVCPQHIVLIALLGSTTSVITSVETIKKKNGM